MKNFTSIFFGFWFKLFGWRIIGDTAGLKKYVFAVAPHTSNWDFGVGYCVKHILKLKPNFLAKNSLFKIPIIGWFLRGAGGVPVDRSKKGQMVDQIVEKFHTMDVFIMAITPEGTRSRNDNWKTGFYFVAHKAGVPIIMAGIDYATKTVTFSDPFYTSGDVDADVEKMKDFFRPMKGRNPENGVH